MRTSHNDSVKDPRTTAITINEEALHKEEFEFKSQTKTERALKTLQRLSGLTTLLSTYQLIPMTLSLSNDPSSFNIISTSLASVSLLLSLGLAYWSTRVLKSEQSRHLLAQDLNWEGLNTGLFVTLLMRAALSLVLIPNFLLQSGNTPSQMVDSGLTTGQSSQINMARTISNLSVPLPLIELMVFFVFLSAAKTTFSHIKQSGRAMSSLIFFANIAMLSTALGLVFSVLRLKAFPFQGNFALIFPSWNLNGLLRLGAVASFTSFVVWLVNFKRWRVPSVFSTMIVGALALGFTALSISGYSNANSVEREHGPEFARPYLGFSNLGMLSAVFGMLVFLGGSYFWKRHYNFIETNRKRNLTGFAVLVGFVLVFAAARTFYWQPFVTSNQGYASTRTYSTVGAKPGPQMTIREALLSQYLLNDLNSLDKGIKDTTKDLNNVITLFENAKRRGFFPKELTTQLWTFTESLDDYEEYVPKTAAMELWQLFGSLDNLQNQLDDASEGVAENSRAIRSYALQLWPWSKSLPEESEDYKDILPKSGVVSKLWSLFGSLDEAQASIDDAKLQLETTKVLYQDAQNKALVTGANVTEFWPWSSSLGDVESYKNILPEDGVNQLWWFFNKVSSAHTKLKEAAQEVRASTKAIANATTSLWPSRMAALSDYRNYVPHEQELQFWSLFGSVNDVENNLNDVSSQLDEVQKLWSPWANSVRSYKTHEEEVIPQIPQAISRLWSLFGSLDKTEESLNDASVKASNTKASIEEAQSKGVLPTDKTVEAWSSHWQDNLPSRMVTTTWFSGWHEVSENLPTPTLQDNTTQLWGDHWSVVDKLPSFLRLKSTPTSQSVWNSDYVTEFPREAATQLFLWFGKANSLENSVNTAKEKVKEVKVKLEDASKKGLIYAENVTSAAKAKLTNEQVNALWSLFGSVNELKDSVDQANEQIKDAQGANLTANTELWPWSDSLNEYDQYEEVLPKIALTELWSLFSHYSDLKQSLNNTAQQIQDTQSQGVWNDSLAEQLPKDISTQFWSLFGSLSDASTKVNEANSKVNSMNNMLSSAQSLGLISKDANVKPTSLEDAASKLNSMNNIKTSAQNLGLIKGDSSSSSTPTTTTTKTGDVGGSLNSLQNQLNSASQKVSNIQSIYNNAQNLGLVAKPGAATPSELWAVSGALNSAQGQLNNANQKLHAAEDIYSSSQNLGLVSRNSAPTELFTFWGSLNDAQNSINTANQKLANVESVYSNAQNLGLVAKEGATPSEFWSFSETLDKSEEYVPKNTELWTLSSSLNSIQSQINTANQKVSNMKSVYSNAQNLGLVSKDTAPATPSQLWSWSKAVDTVDKYREYLPVETVTAFWSLFSSVSDLEDTIDETNKQFQEATEKGALPAPNATETWTAEWVDKVPKESAIQLWTLWNSLNNVQSSLDNTNQKIGNAKTIYTNAQNLGLVSKDTSAASNASQLWGWSHSLQDSVVPSQLWSLWGSLNDAENSVKTANENLDNVEATYQNALNATESDTTQLWSLFGWLTGAQSSLNTANQKLANVESVYQNAQNLGLVSKDNTNTTANAASNQLWALSNSLNNVQSQLSTANRKVSNVKSIYSNAQNLGLVNKDTGSTTQLWSLFGWLTGAQSSLNTANQKLANVQSIVTNAQNLGLVNKDSASASTTATPTTAPTTELFFLWNWLTGAQNSLNTANQKLANVENIYTNAQNLGLVSKDSSAQTTTSTDSTATPNTPTAELWSWFTNSVNSAQAELNNANQKLANVQTVYQNAQNLGLVSKDNTTVAPSELWTLSSSLNSVQSQLNAANRKVSNVKSIYSNAQSLGLVSKQSSTASAPTTETWAWFKNSLDNAQASLNSASQKVSNVKSVYSNAQNLGLVGTVTPATTPNTTELWALFGWLTGAQSSLNTANQKLSNVQSIVTNAQNLGLISKDSASSGTGTTATSPAATTPQTTELWAWFGKSLDSTQATLDDANQKLANAQSVYNNAQNLGLISGDNAATTPETTELWSLFGWLTGAQSSLNTANQKLANAKSIYTNAQNLGLISKDSASTTTAPTDASTTTPTTAPASVTELFFLWNWLTGAQNSLNTANQKLANVQSIYTNAQNLGLVSKDGTTQTTTQTGTTATPTPTTELWGWFKSSLDSAQSSLNDANQKLANVQSVYNNAQNLGLVSKDNTATPSELWSASKTMDGTLNKYEEYVPKLTEMWAWFSNSLNNVQSQLNSADQKVSSIKSIYSSADNLGQNLGVVVQKQGTTDAPAAPDTTEMWAWFTNSLNNVQNQLNTANQKVSNVKSIYSNAQNLGLVSKDTSSSSTTAPATATPQTTELFFLWNWLTGAQNSLNTANQKLANVQSIYNNAQNLGLVSKDGTTGTTGTTATTTTTPTTATTATPSELWSAGQAFNDAMDKYEEYVPKTTELWGWFKSSLDNAQASLNDANQKLNNVQNIYSNAQNLGLVGKDNAATPSAAATPSELWSVGQGFNDAMDKYEEYVPKTTELWAWFSNSLNKAQSQLNAANQKVSDIKNTYSSAETLGKNLGLANNQSTTTATDTTEMWTWFTNSLNNVQNQLNTANQKVSNVKSIYSNAQNLGLVGKDNAATPSTAATPSELWSVGQGFNDAMDKYEEYVPKVVQLWSLFGWLSGAQTSLNDANQKINNVKSIYTNAENLGLISKTGTNGDAAATPATTTTTTTPSQLWSWSQSLDELDDSGVVPKEVVAELWSIFGSLSDLETSVQDANQQIEEAKANYQNSQGELTPEAETKLWSLFGSLSKVESSLNNATDKIENAQNNGLIPSRDTVDDYNAQWLENVSREGATEFWSLFGSLDNLDSSLSDTQDQIQGVQVTYQGAEEQGLIGKEGELTRLFWPFTRPKSNLEVAKEAVQEKAKSAYEAVASAASTSQEKVKNAYDISQEKVKSAYDISQKKVKSAYNTVSTSVSSSAAELKQKAEELTNRAEHVKADVDHARSDSDHINRDSDAIQGKNQGQNQNQNQNQNQAK